jgi:hypothetical protein
MVAVEREVCAGGWRFLCAALLVQTVQKLQAESIPKARPNYLVKSAGGYVKESAYQRRDARAWLGGGVGMITFEDCCDALGVDSERARKAIETHCKSATKRAKVSRR